MHLAQDILLSMASLPPFPIVLQRAIDLLNNPDSSIQDVVDSIQFDQSITANVLKICNSAYFGFKRHIYSLKEALVLMGFRQLIEIILSQEALNLFSNSNSQYKELWLHSVGCAFLSGLTARRLRERTTPIFFTAALLHDIGKLALAKFVKNYLWETNKCIQEEEISFTEAEKRIWGVDHADLGGRIMEIWNFPKPIVAAVRHHHSPLLISDHQEIVRKTYLCDLISIMNGIGGGVERLSYPLYLEILRQNNLKEEDNHWFVVQLKDRFQFLKEVLNLTGDEQNTDDLLNFSAISIH